MSVGGTASTAGEVVACSCCGARYRPQDLIRLGGDAEIGVCERCAHFLHQQARAREDARQPSIAARLRDVLRAGRRVVMQRGWHRNRYIGAPLRWLGRRLP